MLPGFTELVENGTFNPEVIRVLESAFETAWAALWPVERHSPRSTATRRATF
jgi:hypothetical protein